MLELSQTICSLKRIEREIALAFRPPPKLKPSRWVETYRRHSGEANAKTHGKWHNYPMQVEPMDSVVDPEVKSTCLMWAAQTGGKTEVLNGIVGYFIHQEPSPIMMVQPDLNMAEAWSKDRIAPFIRGTKVLSELVDNRTRRSGNTILHKTFPGGHLTAAGANSAASLASRPIRVGLFDEVDRYPLSAGREGDPVLLGEKRQDSFPNAVSFKTSTPTIKKHSRIETEFLLSDQRYWFVKCHKCKHEQTLQWSQVKWPEESRLKDTYYQCANCPSKWDDRARVAAIKKGRWIATAKFNGIRGYHLNGIYSLLLPKKGHHTRLSQMADEFLVAKRLGKEGLKMWVNTFLAETWEEEADVKPAWERLYERREKYDKVPKGVRIITFGTDFQSDRIEVEFVGHGEGEETWGLGHIQLWGDPRLPEIYQRLEATLIKTFTREDGIQMQANAGGFDTGFSACQRQLYSWLRPRLGRRYYAFKGSSVKNAEPISHSSRSKVETVKLIMVGTNRIKTYIYSRATIAVVGPGYMHFPESYTPEWFKQLLMEDSRTETVQGVTYRVFTKPEVILENSTDKNEAIDLRVYALAALYARGVPNWDYEERKNQSRRSVDVPDVVIDAANPNTRQRKKKHKASFMSGLLG